MARKRNPGAAWSKSAINGLDAPWIPLRCIQATGLSDTVAERTNGASGTNQDDVAGQKACLGTREFVNLLTGIS
jgi:hypothetical protein